jgi:hypothetical protein
MLRFYKRIDDFSKHYYDYDDSDQTWYHWHEHNNVMGPMALVMTISVKKCTKRMGRIGDPVDPCQVFYPNAEKTIHST